MSGEEKLSIVLDLFTTLKSSDLFCLKYKIKIIIGDNLVGMKFELIWKCKQCASGKFNHFDSFCVLAAVSELYTKVEKFHNSRKWTGKTSIVHDKKKEAHVFRKTNTPPDRRPPYKTNVCADVHGASICVLFIFPPPRRAQNAT